MVQLNDSAVCGLVLVNCLKITVLQFWIKNTNLFLYPKKGMYYYKPLSSTVRYTEKFLLKNYP